MKYTKDDIYSLAGTLLFHLTIFLVLWFTVLKTIVPEEDGGILVNFGNVNAAAGTFEPMYTGQTPAPATVTPPPPTVPVETPKNEAITQDQEETIALNEAKKKEQKAEAERKRLENAEKERLRQEELTRQRVADEQRQREQAISNQVAGAFGRGTAAGTSQGDAESGTGNQGSPFGNSDHGANEGVGGYGSFSLNGRSIGGGGLPRPDYNVSVEGKIVLEIVVDPRGNVISAEPTRGTTIDSEALRKSAQAAARQAKFNSIKGVNNQQGTITYIYKLN